MDRKELNYEYSSEEGTLYVYVDNVKLKGSGAEVDAGLRKSGYSKVRLDEMMVMAEDLDRVRVRMRIGLALR